MNNNKTVASFDELYMQYHAMVYGIGLSVLHSEESAKDITQEVFIRLYQWRDKIKDENKIKGWLSVTARNLSLNYLRKYKREEELGELYAKNADPEEIFIANEGQRMIHNAVNRLKESYIEVLTLRYSLDFSVKEIAAVTEMPAASVYTRLKRAQKALEKELKEAEK